MTTKPPHVVNEWDNASVYCAKCKRQMAAIARGSYEYWEFGQAGFRYFLLDCTGCRSPFVGLRTAPNYDEVGYMSDDVWGIPEQVYPPIEEALPETVPAEIGKSYFDSKTALRVKLYAATAMQCRRTMDLICNHLGADESLTLGPKLGELKTSGVLDAYISQWAEEVLHPVGNAGAHAREVSEEDAQDAVEFSRAIIDYLFVVKEAFDRFKARRVPP
jgi:hypothetical protein